MKTYITPYGETTFELYDGEEFLVLDSQKVRKAGLYVGAEDHKKEVLFGKTLESVKPGFYKAVHPLNDDADFDVAIVKLETNTLVQIYEFKGRNYSSRRGFTYGPEVQKAAKMRALAAKWGVRPFFAVRWSDGVIRHIELNDEFIQRYHNDKTIGSLFNAKPNRPGETPDDIYHLKPEAYRESLTPYGQGIWLLA